MKQTQTLIACPFCGEANQKSLFSLWESFEAGNIAHVHCAHCGADGPSTYSEESAGDAIAKARARWNGRVNWI